MFASLILLTSLNTVFAADSPASPHEAASVIDLSAFELIRPVEGNAVINRRIAGLSYLAGGSVTSIAGEIKKRLIQEGWSLLDGSMVTDQYASETYQKSGFTLSMSVMPSGQPEEVRITLANLGNVDFKQLPLPSELEPQFQSPVMSMLGSPWSVEETTEKISQALVGTGWTPYGAPAGSRQFKQNGVRLNVGVIAAPAQNNRTVVQVTSEQMSADLPALEGAESIQYSDVTRSISFDHPASMSEAFSDLRTLLERRGWTATTENPIKIGFRDHLIFRNSDKDLMEIACQQVDGKTRIKMDFKDEAEVEALNQRAQAEVARRQAEMAKQAIKERIVIAKPPGAEISETGDSRIEFSLPSGTALSALDAWMAELEKEGWKRTTNVRERVAGNFELKKGEVELNVTYVDPGFIPATISLSVFGKATLQVKP